GSGGQALAHHPRREDPPFLARVQIAVDVRQVPIQVAINRGVQNQRRCNRAAERRFTAIPGIVIAGTRDEFVDCVRCYLVTDAAVVAADATFILVEYRFHDLILGFSRSSNFAVSMTARRCSPEPISSASSKARTLNSSRRPSHLVTSASARTRWRGGVAATC